VPQDYFALLGFPRRFDLDPESLERRYLEAQRRHHPDRLMHLPAEERLKATSRAMEINAAYQTLQSPLLRARHLLALQGIFIASERDTVKPTPPLLMEVMEWREALENAATAEAREAQLRLLQIERDRTIAALASHFAGSDHDAAAQSALRLGYIEKILEQNTSRFETKYLSA
jgi:molecular chaperone HscB